MIAFFTFTVFFLPDFVVKAKPALSLATATPVSTRAVPAPSIETQPLSAAGPKPKLSYKKERTVVGKYDMLRAIECVPVVPSAV